MQKSVVKKCCGEVLWRRGVQKWCSKGLSRSVVEKWCREML